MIKRKHFYIRGSVQGVGFRHRAGRLARRLNLTGYVRNLSDGSVEMELQGDAANIGLLVYEIEQSPFIRIEDLVTETLPLQEETEFRIR